MELPLSAAIDKVADGKVGGFVEHAWAGVAHHLAHLLAHVGLVAVHGAPSAYGLVGAEFAAVDSPGGVLEERGAAGAEGFALAVVVAEETGLKPVCTKSFVLVVVAAEEADHYGDGALFAEEVHGASVVEVEILRWP